MVLFDAAFIHGTGVDKRVSTDQESDVSDDPINIGEQDKESEEEIEDESEDEIKEESDNENEMTVRRKEKIKKLNYNFFMSVNQYNKNVIIFKT